MRDFYAANPGEFSVDLGAAHYLLFILPLVPIGAGFVLATTLRTAIVIAGVVAVIGAGLAWWLIGPRDPSQTVFDMQDEREADDALEPALRPASSSTPES